MGSFECGPGRICAVCYDDAQGIDDSGLCPKCREASLRAELAAAKAENERLSRRIGHLRDMLDDIRHQDSDARSIRVIAATALKLDDCSIMKGR